MNHAARSGLCLVLVVALFSGCRSTEEKRKEERARQMPKLDYPGFGKIERFDAQLDALVPATATIEKLAQGFEWTEGPVWDPSAGRLLFTDVPRNVVYQWREVIGAEVFLKPSGYTGPETRGGESGANGLAFNPVGELVLCQHGDRRAAKWVPPHRFATVAAYYRGWRFNSPNDLTYRSDGSLYFTDPPYGLEQQNTDPKKELLFSGVYRVSPKGEIRLLTDKLTFPNGIAFSPDESVLYVAVSDPQNPVIMSYPVLADGTIGDGKVFFDAQPLAKEGRKGLPDGLKVDQSGNLFATGPGGVLVISPAGQLLGIINTGEATSNCAWGNDGSVLYITADMYLCRVRTSTRGKIFSHRVND